MKAQVPFSITDTFLDAYVKPYYNEGHRFYFKYEYIENILKFCKEQKIHLSSSQTLALHFLYSCWCPIFPDYLERGSKLIKYAIQTAAMEINPDVINAQQLMIQVGNKETLTDASKIIYDLDRIRFAAAEDEYSRYERLVRFEFSHLNDQAWISGRIGVLQNMLKTDNIFVTPEFQNKFEQIARQNLQNQIQQLTESLKDV
ncbi:MAG: hypothetical protein D6B28_03800 [Gammaproteobacteria bacterium]|nr:MAG: hypothetical protein D6B28_03800 [Gammaproteobacteria bacterium]